MSYLGFNLLSDRTSPPDMWDKIYDWVTNVGRVIVIVVEFVVIVAFATRIVVDTQTKGLLEREEQNSQTLEAFRDSELRFRDWQSKFDSYRISWNNGSSLANLTAELTNSLPSDIEELTLSISAGAVDVSGVSTPVSLAPYESVLKASTTFEEVVVPNLEASAGGSGEQSLDFTITGTPKPDRVANREQIGGIADSEQPVDPVSAPVSQSTSQQIDKSIN